MVLFNNIVISTIISLALCRALRIGSFSSPHSYSNKVSRTNSNFNVHRSTKVDPQLSSQPDDFYLPQNLKKSPGQSDRPIMDTYNEVLGLSEKEFLFSEASSDKLSRVLNLAYRRCEYVTQLFSKTFYMGTSLMRPEVRKHVWAIYAWCRRTDDIVDSPRALLNREILRKDLKDWDLRLDMIWNQQPVDLFDLAMSDTVRTYPTITVTPYRDMIAGEC